VRRDGLFSSQMPHGLRRAEGLTEKLLEVPAQLIEAALNLELEDGAIVADDLEGRA